MFIGRHYIIIKGVTIGGEAIIDVVSIIMQDVPAEEIW